jgi:uncharacterized membrane protein
MSAPVAPADQPRKPRINRWLAAALIVSAAANLAFIGWGAARYIHHARLAERPPSGQIEDQITRRMPERAATAFRAAVEKDGRLPRGAFQRFRHEIAGAIAAEPYDRAKLAALLDEHRRRLDTFQENVQSGLLAAVDAMSPDERRDYAHNMLRHRPPPPPPPPGEDGPPMPPGGRPMDGRPMDGGGQPLPPPPK